MQNIKSKKTLQILFGSDLNNIILIIQIKQNFITKLFETKYK
jgi:hypothetical protein